MHFEFIWLFLILSHVIYQANANFLMYRIYNGGCPYTATFLVHVDFFSRLHYELHWHKMEAVNWNVIGIARFNFQFVNESLYYVHHMSRYEHSSRQKYGYNVSEEMTAIMATAAMKGECNTVRMTKFHNSSIGLVPFYGARPPNVTADLKVKSLGQGNSLVKAEIKATQLLATVCSILNELGSVVVGVVRKTDYNLVHGMVNSLPKEYSSRIKIQTIEGLGKPANLPFGLIMWAKKYIFRLNCLYNKFHGIPDPIIRGNKRSKTPLCSSLIDLHTNTSTQDNPPRRITHVYYTESDQLLRFMNSEVRDTIIGALNITSHLIGRRKEKNIKIPSGPTDYMGGLLPTRDVCGNKSLPFELSVHDSMVRPVPLGTTG